MSVQVHVNMYWFLVASLLVGFSLCANEDGGKAPRIPLNDGHSIPVLGLGTSLQRHNKFGREAIKGKAESAVTWALGAGYRLIDTAASYENEDEIGDAIWKSPIHRENIFVVTKLMRTNHRQVVNALRKSLSYLNQSYVDLYLIHSPMSFKPDSSGYDTRDYLHTWRAMEEAKKLGLAKSIGISNFNISQIERILKNCEIKPAVLQVEVNINFAQSKLIEFCNNHNIVVMAYTPFGTMFDGNKDLPAPRADDPILKGLAEKYNKTSPQIILRYLVQRGVVPIPKSVHKNRIEENIDIFDIELNSNEMETLSKFNKDYRKLPIFWQDHPYYPFEKKDVPDPDPFNHIKD